MILQNLTTIFEEVVQSINPPRKNYIPRTTENESTQAVAGSVTKPATMIPERKSRACPKCSSTDPTHTWRTCKGKEINMIEDTSDPQEEGQLEFDFFNQEDSEDDIDIQAIGMYEGDSDRSSNDIRYCNTMTLVRPPHQRAMSEETTWVKPHLQVLVQGKTANMLLDSGADMSFISFELMEQLKPDWLINLHSCGEKGYWYRTVNSNIPIFGKIVIPVTITDILSQSCTLMIEFIIIEKLERSMMVMGADALQKYQANIHFGEVTLCTFFDSPTVFQTNDGKTSDI